ncbi:DNA-binding protein SMUBP-2 [Blattella germanica]|nr:DNA-binding protein SMUBP-2 [Blattella germanica]
MCAVYEEEIVKFCTKHLSLIEEERKEECLQTQKLINSCHGSVHIKNLDISSYSSCLGGYVLAEFRNSKSKLLPPHNLCRGDVVGVVEGSNIQDTPVATGVVKFCREDVIGVSFEDVNFNEDDKTYSLVKLANDVTYSRLKSSLNDLRTIHKHPGRVIAELLFGENNNLEEIPLPPKLLNSAGDLDFINTSLHVEQKEAVKFALKMKNLAVIHGPPGTGKTTTLVEIILQTIKIGHKILVCAPSNVAVDNIVEKLSHHHVKMIRLGHPARIMENISKYSLDALIDSNNSSQIVRDVRRDINSSLNKLKSRQFKESRTEIRSELKSLRKELQERETRVLHEVLRGADVIVSTLVTASANGPLKHIPEEHFDCILIDECSQALEAACWIVLPKAKKAILAGDHHQLPPTIISKKAEQEGLGLSLMERVVKKFGKAVYRLLVRQFRMHRDIMMWPSKEMYDGRLEADPSVESHLLKDLPLVETTDETEIPLLFIDTSDSQFEEEVSDMSICNRGEAGIISVLVKRLVTANVPQKSIAIITPYNYQVEMIRAYIDDLKDIEVRSVDGFQGREKEAVFLSLVRSNPQKELGFITDERRLNVAVSRARRFLCIVADSRTVSHNSTIASLLDYASENGIVQVSEQYTSHIETPRLIPQKQTMKTQSQMGGCPEKKSVKKSKVQIKQKEILKSEPRHDKRESSVEEMEHWCSVIEKFVNSEDRELKFSKSISAYDRKLIHEAAEKFKLNHNSVGEGNERYIVVTKVEHGNNSKNNVTRNKQSNTNEREQSVRELDTGNSSTEERKSVQKHVLETKKVQKKIVNEKTAPVSQGGKEMKIETKKQEKSKKPTKKQEPEDFESLMAEFQEMDKKCHWSTCSTPTDLVGLVCVHCKHKFCLTHGLPEIHGCGEAARKLAKQEFRHPRPAKSDPIKRNAASRKLEKKLQQMSDERKPRKK